MMLFIPLARIATPLHIDYNEGWNAYHALDSRKGNIYGKELTPVNYPPISFYFLGLFPDPLFAGRFVSLISLLICCFIVSYIVYQHKHNLFAASVSGVFSLSIFLGLAQWYVGMNDPQLFAEMIMLAALMVYIVKKNLFITALLIAISLFIKHNMFAIPLSIALDLLINNRKDFLKFVGYLSGFTILGILGSQAISEGKFISSLLMKREYSLRNALYLFVLSLAPLLPTLSIPVRKKRNRSSATISY